MAKLKKLETEYIGKTISNDEALSLAIELATNNAEQGGGPFGCVIVSPDNAIAGIGINSVVESHDSTAHAEVVAIRSAQQRIQSHSLNDHSLYTSCAPCIMCFGVIYWSGVKRVIAGATKEDAESLGFLEGPMSPELWQAAARDKSIEFLSRAEHPNATTPFQKYKELGGVIY